MLPFTADVFFALFEPYNAAIWPAQIVAYLLGLAALLLTLRPIGWSDRLVAALLAAAWIWIGVVYHLMHFATINFSAPVFGALFILEGVLFIWTGVVRGRLTFRLRAAPVCWTGLGLAILAMIYPVLGSLAGHAWPRAAMFGVAPCPTTIFTLGLLLLVEGRKPLHLAAIPVLWAIVAGLAAWFLAIPEGAALPLAALVALGLMLWRKRAATRCHQRRPLSGGRPTSRRR